MGLYKSLLETYEKCESAIGVSAPSVDGEIDERKTLLPVFHMTFKSQLCIILDGNGHFADAERDKKDSTIIIPCTESSAGRSSAVAAHPLCDQLDYLCGINNEKTIAYLKELGAWEEQASGIAKTKLKAVYTYVSANTMLADLEEKQIFKDSEYKEQGNKRTLVHERIRKLGVRFVVEIKSDLIPKLWQDHELRQSWIAFVKRKGSEYQGFDYLSGVEVRHIASQHPKNINAMTGNAKLLSCNDLRGYTFRGRFSSQDDAVMIDYEQSQKMHQALRWLINNLGYSIDSQTIIVWAVDKDTSPLVKPHQNSHEMLWAGLKTVSADVNKPSEAAVVVDANYSKEMRKLFQGYGKIEKIKMHTKTICIAVFDAATTGRMGLIFYQELPQDEYFNIIEKWHSETSYYLTFWTKETDKMEKKNRYHTLISAPLLMMISCLLCMVDLVVEMMPDTKL